MFRVEKILCNCLILIKEYKQLQYFRRFLFNSLTKEQYSKVAIYLKSKKSCLEWLKMPRIIGNFALTIKQ